MPKLNWAEFEKLGGSIQDNFEMLCRMLIRHHFGQNGQFLARANQPGVEFHLRLETDCVLGKKGRWFGWQCRWYDLPSGTSLGASRKKKIKEALSKTKIILPKLTDWVLWTRHPLSKKDQEWFYGLDKGIRLELYTTADVERFLTGDAEIFRATYFNELVLTSNSLEKLHANAVAPIRFRWRPEVHQPVDVERQLRRMLAETNTWNNLQKLARRLKAVIRTVDQKKLPASLIAQTAEISEFACAVAKALNNIYAVLSRGDLDLLKQELADRPGIPSQKLLTLPRQLRASRHPASLAVTNMLADILLAKDFLDKLEACLGKRVVAVVADAGCGKTQLAAQLTAAVNGLRPPGILLHGHNLLARESIDDFARQVIIQGKPAQNMEALLASVDAAGQRAHRRLPIIIDGLNEAEDPRDWKSLLATLEETLGQYPYVLVVCTLRSMFVLDSLPSDVTVLNMPGFGNDISQAIKTYFVYYKINYEDADLPLELLSHPLTLRLFCEVTNPKRDKYVGIEAMPRSLAGLFDRYIDQAASRIAQLAPLARRYCEQDVRMALSKIGEELWEKKARNLDLVALRTSLGDNGCLWNESIVRALEQEGILLREPGAPLSGSCVAGVFDAFSGYLVASTLLAKYGRSEFEQWIKDPKVLAELSGPYADRHPLSEDILLALVALLPRFQRPQLWTLVDGQLRTIALYEAARLESAYLDAPTVKEIAALTICPGDNSHRMFVRLWYARSSANHPLNAEFLDSVLRPLSVTNRDLIWSEWLRQNTDGLIQNIQNMEKRWRDSQTRSVSDKLRARWIMWLLTSTVHSLRDQTTRTLYWFGRGAPNDLFALTLDAFGINDPYVLERMLAASYGITMALQHDKSFATGPLSDFAKKLYEVMFSESAPSATTHILSRDYARHILDVAVVHNPRLLTKKQRNATKPPFNHKNLPKWGKSNDKNENEYRDGNYPFGFSFDNYTLGYLLPGRQNYDFKDPGYVELKSNMWWRIYQLGYTLKDFGEIDKRISHHIHSRGSENVSKIDRYGKKYCWIAWHEIAGARQDKGLLKSKWDSERIRFTWDIDPSFPEELKDTKLVKADYLQGKQRNLEDWISKGPIPDITPYLILENIQNIKGPWVLLDGVVKQENLDSKRDVFVYVRGLMLENTNFTAISNLLKREDLGGRWLPEVPQEHEVFAGEIAWSDTFHNNEPEELSFVSGKYKKRVPFEKIEFMKDGKKLAEERVRELLMTCANWKDEKDNEAKIEEYFKKNNIQLRKAKAYRIELFDKAQKYKARIPVVGLHWSSERSDLNPKTDAYVLSKEICNVLSLTSRPQTFDLYDKNSEKASLTLKWGGDWQNYHKLTYIRQDMLDLVLNNLKAKLLWAIWGERQRTTRDISSHQAFVAKHPGYKGFKKIITYK